MTLLRCAPNAREVLTRPRIAIHHVVDERRGGSETLDRLANARDALRDLHHWRERGRVECVSDVANDALEHAVASEILRAAFDRATHVLNERAEVPPGARTRLSSAARQHASDLLLGSDSA